MLISTHKIDAIAIGNGIIAGKLALSQTLDMIRRLKYLLLAKVELGILCIEIAREEFLNMM